MHLEISCIYHPPSYLYSGNIFDEINLLDDCVVTDVRRVTISGMAIDIRSNNTKASPQRYEQRQLQQHGDDHSPILLLKLITILY